MGRMSQLALKRDEYLERGVKPENLFVCVDCKDVVKLDNGTRCPKCGRTLFYIDNIRFY